MGLAACVELDWTQAATAAVAAILAALTTVQAKRRPAGKRTRASDRAPGHRRVTDQLDPDLEEPADVPFDWPAARGLGELGDTRRDDVPP